MDEEVKDVESLLSDIEGKLKKIESDLTAGVLVNNEKVKNIIALIQKIKKDEVNTSELEERFEKCKSKLHELKNYQILLYNTQIRYLRKKHSFFEKHSSNYDEEIKNRIKEIGEALGKIEEIDFMSVNPEWKSNGYFSKFDYTSLINLSQKLKDLESESNVKSDAGNYLDSMLDTIGSELGKIESEMDNLSPQEIVSMLDKCLVLDCFLIFSEKALEKLRNKLYEEKISGLNSKIVPLKNNLSDIRERLIKKRSSSVYNELDLKIKNLESEYTNLFEVYFPEETKCSESVVNMFRRNLKKLKEKYDNIILDIEAYFGENIINEQQKKNLLDKIEVVSNIHNEFNEKLTNEPAFSNSDDIFVGLDEEFNKLETDIEKMGSKPIKDRKERNSVGRKIDDLEKNLYAIEKVITRFKGIDDEKYKRLIEKYNMYKGKLDGLNQQYSSKCPLHVKTIRKAKPIYQKHPKLSLISAGLSSFALVSGAHTIIPAIMHGNQVLGSAVPAVNGMMMFFNKILGGIIGATYKGSSWILSTGVTLTSVVATTSILKFIGTLAVGAATVAMPLYVPSLVKRANGLMKKVNFVSSIKNLGKKYKDLLDEFNSEENLLGFEEFCKLKNMTDEDKEEFLKYIKNKDVNVFGNFSRKKKK